jgi:hypothetical protein
MTVTVDRTVEEFTAAPRKLGGSHSPPGPVSVGAVTQLTAPIGVAGAIDRPVSRWQA